MFDCFLQEMLLTAKPIRSRNRQRICSSSVSTRWVISHKLLGRPNDPFEIVATFVNLSE